MADNLSVSTIVNSQRKVVGLEANLSDSSNDSFSIVGVPGKTYDLTSIQGSITGTTIASSPVTSTPPSNIIRGLIDTGLQESQPVTTMVWTDINGNTITFLGIPNTIYDLSLLPYLLAVVSAQDMFMAMQFGDDYQNAKNDFLNRAGLV
jgi:hypothetical protein